MKEMKKNELYLRSDCHRNGVIYLDSQILYAAIYEKINEMTDYQNCFRLSSYSDKQKNNDFDDFYIYIEDMCHDGFKIINKGINELHLSKGSYTPVSYTELVNEWFYQCNELLTDFRIFLRQNNIEIYDTLERYRTHKLQRKLKKAGI